MRMYCTRCGTQLGDEARFCVACGSPTAALAGMASPAGMAAPAPRRLRRILAGKKIAGVCTGFAEYFGTDVTLMRIIWLALLLLPPNVGLIAYIISWIVLPKA
jgi:phage shock protein C